MVKTVFVIDASTPKLVSLIAQLTVELNMLVQIQDLIEQPQFLKLQEILMEEQLPQEFYLF